MKKRFFLIMTVAFLSSSFLAGCGEISSQNEAQGPTIRIFMNQGNKYEGIQNSIITEIEKNAKVKLDITGAAYNGDYYSTLNPMINTGDIPDLIFAVPGDSANSYNSWVNQDIIWNYDELLAQYPGEFPHLEKILNSDQFKNLTYGDSAHTLLPYLTSRSGWGIYYRADWLINVGYYDMVGGKKIARTPSTIEEFQDVMEKFTEDDPDQDGEKDTYAISPSGSMFFLNPLYHAFGVTPDYDIDENNKGTYMYLNSHFKDFLTWFNSMSAKGYVDPQWPTNANYKDRDKFTEGQTGILITNAEQHVSWIAGPLAKVAGEGTLTLGKPPVGTRNLGVEGAGGFSNWGGYWGGYSISKDAKDPEAILRLLDFMYSQKGTDLRCYGIEGKHYTIENGEKVPNLEERAKEPEGTFLTAEDESGNKVPSGYCEFGSDFGNDLLWDGDDVTNRINSKMLDSQYADLIDLGVANTTLCASKLLNVTNFYSTYTSKMNKLKDTTNTYAINAALGKKNLTTDWDEMLSSLSQSTIDWPGIQKMLEEVAKKAGIIS